MDGKDDDDIKAHQLHSAAAFKAQFEARFGKAPRSTQDLQTLQNTPVDAKRMTAAHAGGALGERELRYAAGQRGWVEVSRPAGAGLANSPGHALTASGIDAAFVDPKTGHLHLVDNKASGKAGTVRSCSALMENLKTNLHQLREDVQQQANHPHRIRVLDQLDRSIKALESGKRLPPDVHLTVTNSGGYVTGISPGLQKHGFHFLDMNPVGVHKSRENDIQRAKAQGDKPSRPRSY